MSIYSNLREVRKLNSSSLSSIVNISNENFEKISQSLYTYLTNIVYNETDNSMSMNDIEANLLKINRRIELIVNTDTMFSVNEAGEVRSKTFVADDIAEARRFRLFRYDGYPLHGIPGEIVYGKRSLTEPLDFWGYIQGMGWLSLTGQNNNNTGDGSWSGGVIGIFSDAPIPSSYGRYIVDWRVTATGEFAGHEGQIAQWNIDQNIWEFYDVLPGAMAAVEGEFNKIYVAQPTDPISWNTYGDANAVYLSVLDQEHHTVSTLTTDSAPTSATISEAILKNSQVLVTINGVKVVLGNGSKLKDAYFSRDNGVTAVNLDSIQVADQLIWNAVISGYTIEPTDTISIDYLTQLNSGGGSTPSGGSNNKVDITIGNTVESGDFVNIYDDSGITKIRPASAMLGRIAHGYVKTGGITDTIGTVYLDGINNKLLYIPETPSAIGQEIYLGENGKVVFTLPSFGSPNGWIQTLGNYIGTYQAIVNIDVNPIEI